MNILFLFLHLFRWTIKLPGIHKPPVGAPACVPDSTGCLTTETCDPGPPKQCLLGVNKTPPKPCASPALYPGNVCPAGCTVCALVCK